VHYSDETAVFRSHPVTLLIESEMEPAVRARYGPLSKYSEVLEHPRRVMIKNKGRGGALPFLPLRSTVSFWSCYGSFEMFEKRASLKVSHHNLADICSSKNFQSQFSSFKGPCSGEKLSKVLRT